MKKYNFAHVGEPYHDVFGSLVEFLLTKLIKEWLILDRTYNLFFVSLFPQSYIGMDFIIFNYKGKKRGANINLEKENSANTILDMDLLLEFIRIKNICKRSKKKRLNFYKKNDENNQKVKNMVYYPEDGFVFCMTGPVDNDWYKLISIACSSRISVESKEKDFAFVFKDKCKKLGIENEKSEFLFNLLKTYKK